MDSLKLSSALGWVGVKNEEEIGYLYGCGGFVVHWNNVNVSVGIKIDSNRYASLVKNTAFKPGMGE